MAGAGQGEADGTEPGGTGRGEGERAERGVEGQGGTLLHDMTQTHARLQKPKVIHCVLRFRRHN